MPNQYGEVTGQDWFGLVNAIGNVENIRQGREYLGMRKAEEERNKIEFGQKQEDRTNEIAGREAAVQGLINSGVLNETGTDFSSDGISKLASTKQSGQDVDKSLGSLGDNAYNVIRSTAELTGNLLTKKENLAKAQEVARKMAEDNYSYNIEAPLAAARVQYERGEADKAANNLVYVVENSMMRRHARKTDDGKIELWETVSGVKQPSQVMSVGQALDVVKDWKEKDFVIPASANILAGWASNQSPKELHLKDPQGNEMKALQIMRSGEVEYLFFDKNGRSLDLGTKSLEPLWDKGYMPYNEEEAKKLEKLGLDLTQTRGEIAYKTQATEESKARTEKIREESGKEPKRMAPDEARERLFNIVKFESSLNKTGGWDEISFNLMAEKNPDFAALALKSTSGKKKVVEEIDKLKKYYKSVIGENVESTKSGKIDIEAHRQWAIEAIEEKGQDPEKVKAKFKLLTGEDL
jgi:hypothetical protein